MSLKTELIHWKIIFFGDKKLEKKGEKILPCIKCNEPFVSFVHYRGGCEVFDDTCSACLNKKKMKTYVVEYGKGRWIMHTEDLKELKKALIKGATVREMK